MSAKRQAQFDIDQKTLQDKPAEVANAPQNAQPVENKQISDRKIISVKKDDSQKNVQQNGKKQTKQQPKSTGLFGSLFNNNNVSSNGTGLFNNGTKTTTSNTGGLFSNPVGLFSNNSSGMFSSTTTGLFSNKPAESAKPTGGLFGSNNNSKPSIFNFQSGGVPPVKNTSSSLFAGNQQQDDSGDSAELQAGQNLQVDPTKSTAKYQYEQACKVLINQKAFKFKKQGGDLIQNVQVVVKQDNGSQMYLISVLLPATKKSIFNGIILPKKSQVKHLNNKKQNVEKQKLQQFVLKFQFQKQQQGTQLFNIIDSVIKGQHKFQQKQKTTGNYNQLLKLENSQAKKDPQTDKVKQSN